MLTTRKTESMERRIKMTQHALRRLAAGACTRRGALFGPDSRHSDNVWQLYVLEQLTRAGVIRRIDEGAPRNIMYEAVPGMTTHLAHYDANELVQKATPSQMRQLRTREQNEEQPLVKTNSMTYVEAEASVGAAANDEDVAGDDVADGAEDATTAELLKAIVMWCNHFDERLDTIQTDLEKMKQWLSVLAE